jgi:DNA-binding SARP family transcriptional activator
MARDRVLLLLWPESATDRARGALYQLLYVVRKAFGEQSVIGTDELRLEASIVDSDVSEFIDALARSDLAGAVAAYAGPFLDGVHLPDVPELERWVEQKRQELARSYQSALARLAAQAMDHRDYSAAIAFAERLVADDPLSERATMLLMEALAATGDVAAALERARAHALVVRRELDADVDAGVAALAARLRSKANRENPVVAPAAPVDALEPAVQARASLSPTTSPRFRVRRFAIPSAALVGVAVIGVAVMASALWSRSLSTLIESGRLSARDTLVLADFEVAGLDSGLAPALTAILRRDFTDSRAVSLLPSSTVNSALERMRRDPGTVVTPTLAREIGQREGARAVLIGRVSPLGSGYIVTLRLIASETGNELASTNRTAPSAEKDLLPALSRASEDLRQRIGESLRDASGIQAPERKLTTTSLEALRLAWPVSGPSRSAEQKLTALQKAVRLDTAFAYAWMSIGTILSNGGNRSMMRDSAFSMAYRLRDHLTPMERAQVSYMYLGNALRDRGLALAQLQTALDVDSTLYRAAPLNLAETLLETRQFERAEAFARRMEKWKTVGSGALYELVRAQAALGEYAAVDSTLARWRSVAGGDSAGYFGTACHVAISALRFDSAEMLLAKTPESDGIGDRIAMLRLRGRLREADLLVNRSDSIRASESAAAGARFDPGPKRALAKAREALWISHDPRAAIAQLDRRWHTPSPIRDIQDRVDGVQAAALYAAAGEPRKARALLETFENIRDTLATRAIYEYGQAARAEIALNENRFPEAMERFRASDIAVDGLPATACAVCVLPSLARVAERAGWSDSATVLWEAYVSRPAIERLSTDQWFLASAYERLAALASQRGDPERAATYRGARLALRQPKGHDAPIAPR